MKTLLPLASIATSLLTIAHAAPPDEELLKLVKNRAQLERVTQTPKDMEKRAMTTCAIDGRIANGKSSSATSPHQNATIHVFTNEVATLPIFDPWGKFPEGSLILKEKFSKPEGKTQLFTGMWKREKGYFPETGDWEFFTVDAEARKIVERGKLESCAKCHQEYDKGDFVTKLYAAPTQLTSGRVVLHSSKAETHGEKLHYEELEKKNTLGFWVNPKDWAEWKFAIDKPGTFEIHVWQGCGKGSGGSEVELICAGQTSKFTVEDTGHFQNFKERVVGTVKFDKAGPQTFEVRAISKPGAAVMDLRQVILVPKAEQ